MEDLPALTIALVILSFVLSYLLHQVCLRSENIRKKLRQQGVKGPKPTVFFGNTGEMKRIQQELKIVQMQDANNYLSTLFPHLLLWRETYGRSDACKCYNCDLIICSIRLMIFNYVFEQSYIGETFLLFWYNCWSMNCHAEWVLECHCYKNVVNLSMDWHILLRNEILTDNSPLLTPFLYEKHEWIINSLKQPFLFFF